MSEYSTVQIFEELWRTHQDHPAVATPGFWCHILTKNQDSSNSLMYMDLIHCLMKIIKMWNMFYQEWTVESFEDLQNKTSQVLAITYKTLWPSMIGENVQLSTITCLNKEPILKDECLDSALTTTIATYFTTVLSQAATASASGRGICQLAKKRKRNDSSDDDVQSSDEEIGQNQSYICSFKNDKKKKFGLMEDFRDYKTIITVYRRKNWKTSDKYWEGTTVKMDLTYDKNGHIDQAVRTLLERGKENLTARGAKTIKEERPNGKSSWRRYRN